MDLYTSEFNETIKKIKTKRIIALVLLFAFVLGVFLSFPLCFIGALACLIAYVFFGVPIYNALYIECDAKKHLAMLTALEREKSTYPMLASAYFYTGDFDTSMYYCKKVLELKQPHQKLAGLFMKARNEFFLGKTENFFNTATEFNSLFSNAKLSEKKKKVLIKQQNIINLLSAIISSEKEKINVLASKLEAWEDTKIVNAFINYLRGVASHELNDAKESTYRFMAVSDVAEKTILGTLAKEYLDKMNEENNI